MPIAARSCAAESPYQLEAIESGLPLVHWRPECLGCTRFVPKLLKSLDYCEFYVFVELYDTYPKKSEKAKFLFGTLKKPFLLDASWHRSRA